MCGVVHRSMNDWHIAYVLAALNPVFLIVNILIASLEVCSASVVAAGTSDFCANLLHFLSVAATTTTSTTAMPLSTSAMMTYSTMMTSSSSVAPCNIVHSMLDLDTNSTITYTLDMCATTPLTSTIPTAIAQAVAVAHRFGQLWTN